jgi:hypothetical protein
MIVIPGKPAIAGATRNPGKFTKTWIIFRGNDGNKTDGVLWPIFEKKAIKNNPR